MEKSMHSTSNCLTTLTVLCRRKSWKISIIKKVCIKVKMHLSLKVIVYTSGEL